MDTDSDHLGANMQCITTAEQKHLAEQQDGEVADEALSPPSTSEQTRPNTAHINLAAG